MISVRNIYISSSSIFFFIVSLSLFMAIGEGYDPFSVKMLAAFAVLLIIHQGATRYKMSREANWVQIDIMFLLMFFFVHFWHWIAVQYGFASGMEKSTAHFGRVNYAVGLALLGMAAFLLGFNLMSAIYQRPFNSASSQHQWEKFGFIMFYTGTALTVLYAVYFGANAFEGNYTGSEVGGLATRSIYMLQGILLKIGILILLIASADEKRFIPKCRVPLFILACILAMFLVLGDRSEFLYTLAVVLFAYTRYYKKIPLAILAMGFVAFAFIMSAVQMARTEETRSLSTIYEVVSSNSNEISSIQGLNGISASGGVLLGAVNAVPKHHAYFFGDLKMIELLGIIPYGRALFLDSAPIGQFGTSSEFLTWFILGPNSKSGTGTTIIADLYVDFGPVGVAVGLLMLGCITSYLHIKVNQMNTLEYGVIFCYFAGLMVLLPRYNFLMIIRGLIWPALFLWLINKLFMSSRREALLISQENSYEKRTIFTPVTKQ
ncbi:MAG: O-antigen polymerase [Nitrospirales bacterium]|nr:oligosaccharide repeat unit polymerase [Nitrospirales bacterium]